MKTEEILSTVNEKNVVAGWDDAHRYTPAPRHRRRLILKRVRRLDFADCLDAGCAQPFLLRQIVQEFHVPGFGCDISDQVIEANRQSLPDCEFRVLDLTREPWPGGQRFDLVICSEVLEHIPDWREALANLSRMVGKHLIITVPSGPRRLMDELVGHHQHFRGPELVAALEGQGLVVEDVRFWGFPLHSWYKSAISCLSPAGLYNSFSGGRHYGWGKRLFAQLLYGSFFVNDLFTSGCQLIVTARRQR